MDAHNGRALYTSFTNTISWGSWESWDVLGEERTGKDTHFTILFYHYKYLVMKQMIVEENKNVQNQSSKISESFVDNFILEM